MGGKDSPPGRAGGAGAHRKERRTRVRLVGRVGLNLRYMVFWEVIRADGSLGEHGGHA